MIDIENINKIEKPYIIFHKFYFQALKKNQKNIEAIAISSFDTNANQVESRFVNLKYIKNKEWIFFSNYKSNKANNFKNFDQISALFYWNTINVQIRIKARVKKTLEEISNEHFDNRSKHKNALAVSSNQSSIISSYDKVLKNYNEALNKRKLLESRPDYWGGYSFYPYYFEFWEGHETRINKRKVFEIQDNDWIEFMLQP